MQIETLSQQQRDNLFITLKARFEKNMNRHPGIKWENVQKRLDSEVAGAKLWSLFQMEETGGEPDIVGHDETTNEYIVWDCSAESPKGRRSVCYDHDALESRKENKPKDSALGMCDDMGIELLTDEQYAQLQEFGSFDTKTSSWLRTPTEIREMGGAIFGDRRYNHVFIYHNGAESYYAARGFRGALRI